MKTRLHPIWLATLPLMAATSIATADTFFPLSGPNAICLRFDTNISVNVQAAISNDFNKCLASYATSLELYSPLDDPLNNRYILDFFQPYGGFAAIEGIGPRFPEHGTYSNGIFTIGISLAFATNFQHHIDSTAEYSNEIAAAYAFIESLSPTNLAIMSTNELLSLDLWKEVPPGHHRPPAEDLDEDLEYYRSRRVFPPPRAAFHVWECGPTNNPPYLWCTVPRTNELGRIFASMMIFYQSRWYFSSWPFQEGEQKW